MATNAIAQTVTDCTRTSVEQAVMNTHPLADFEEYAAAGDAADAVVDDDTDNDGSKYTQATLADGGESRAERALTDVVAVEELAPGMCRVVTWSDAHDVDMRQGGCHCPDKQYNLDDHPDARCKHEVAAILYARDDVPGVSMDDNLGGKKILADGGETVKPSRPKGHNQFTVADHENHTAFHFETNPEADDQLKKAKDVPGVDPELFKPGNSPEWLLSPADNVTSEWPNGGEPDEAPDEDLAPETEEVDPEVIEHTPDDDTDAESVAAEVIENGDDHAPEADHTVAADPAPDTDHAPEALSQDEVEQYAADLDDRDVGEDPLKWMPGEFVDTIDGSPAINRKGFEVIRFFYGIDLDMEREINPEDNDMTHCRYKAVATTPDGSEFEAWGTSHVDRGDDPWLLIEMAATRARKRAISIATGAGAVAVEELRNEPEGRQ